MVSTSTGGVCVLKQTMTAIMTFSTGLRLALTCITAMLFCLVSQTEGVCEGTTIDQALSHCFVHYHTLTSNVEFYKGMDAETLRSICTTTRLAVQCTHRKCPRTSQEELIEVLPSDVLSVMDICVYKDILEVYARNRNCFSQTTTSSERCHNNFEAASQNLEARVKSSNLAAIGTFCGEFKKMVECIKASVSTKCTPEAANLVDLLVRPSIRFSENCPREGVSTTQSIPTQKPAKPISIDDQDLLQTGAQNTGSKTNTVYLVSLILTLFITWFVKPV